MPTFLILLLTFFFIILLFWVMGFLFATDFSVSLRGAQQFHRVLAIFPHADDEAISCGGFLHRVTRGGSRVTLALLTSGERGPNSTRDSNLRDIRTKEARAVASILGITRLIQEDFGDGELQQKRPELAAFIATLIEQEKPELLITYDLAGFYGHLDHIACSEIITELTKTSFPQMPLWYVTFPRRILARVKLPEDMVAAPRMQEKRAYPTHRLFIGASVFPKIKAWYTYKSQLLSLSKGAGIFAPTWLLWFFLTMMLFEYFAEVSETCGK